MVVAAGACGAAPSKIRERRRDRATARARRPRDRAAVLRRLISPIDAAAGRAGLQTDAAKHSVAQGDLDLVHGPARVFVGKKLHDYQPHALAQVARTAQCSLVEKGPLACLLVSYRPLAINR